jgi:hypothetical protein
MSEKSIEVICGVVVLLAFFFFTSVMSCGRWWSRKE